MSNQLTRKQLGVVGEGLALAYLQELEYFIVEKNWRCRTGEIDLIARDGDHLVFVEVRTRSGGQQFGTPQESVNLKKQQQVMETARFYMYTQQKQHLQPRFDVVGIITTKDGNQLSLDHVKNAF